MADGYSPQDRKCLLDGTLEKIATRLQFFTIHNRHVLKRLINYYGDKYNYFFFTNNNIKNN